MGDRELLAIKLALEEWRHWLENAAQPFVVWMDHKNLEYIRSAKRPNARPARWALFFTRFQLSITYRPGSPLPSFSASPGGPLLQKMIVNALPLVQFVPKTTTSISHLPAYSNHCLRQAAPGRTLLSTSSPFSHLHQVTQSFSQSSIAFLKLLILLPSPSSPLL